MFLAGGFQERRHAVEIGVDVGTDVKRVPCPGEVAFTPRSE